jgi:hypothetical protein
MKPHILCSFNFLFKFVSVEKVHGKICAVFQSEILCGKFGFVQVSRGYKTRYIKTGKFFTAPVFVCIAFL